MTGPRLAALALRAASLLLVLAAAAACGSVTPAFGPPTYGDGRGNSSN